MSQFTEITEEKDLLRQKLELKNLMLDGVLQLTRAINYNFSSKSILEMLRYLLATQLHVSKFLLYLNDDAGWQKMVAQGVIAFGMPNDPQLYPFKSDAPDWITEDQTLFYDEFDYVIPVFHKDQALAYLFLGNLPWEDKNTLQEMVDYIQSVCNIVVVANENKRMFRINSLQEKVNHELSLASQIQGMLIPDKLPSTPQLNISPLYLPNRNVGGDFYDFIPVKDGSVVFCIADVSGKGVPAAILMASFQASLRSLVAQNPCPKTVVEHLNQRVMEITKGDRFITLFIARLFENGRLEYVNAGHVPPMLCRAGTLKELKIGSTILGVFDELPALCKADEQLEKGDLLLLYTDGLTDTCNYKKQAYESERLGEFLLNNANFPVAEINKKLLTELMRFKGETDFVDDLSLLTIGFYHE